MRQLDDLRQEIMEFLWSLMPQITKSAIEAENISLPSETEFFNRIGHNATFPGSREDQEHSKKLPSTTLKLICLSISLVDQISLADGKSANRLFDNHAVMLRVSCVLPTTLRLPSLMAILYVLSPIHTSASVFTLDVK